MEGLIMAYKKKTWTEKLNDRKKFPKTLPLEKNFPCAKSLEKWGAKPGDSVVLTPPIEVDEIMKKVPKGKLITIYEICSQLAKKHNADYCCSLTTGIFINIAANATEEAKERGEKNTTPYWRTVKAEGLLNEKYPGGAIDHKKLLEKEGFKIIQKGKKYFVENYEKYLVKGY
jgi:hypothetical protein